jgi:uncharacterized delta-60 repeat protein
MPSRFRLSPRNARKLFGLVGFLGGALVVAPGGAAPVDGALDPTFAGLGRYVFSPTLSGTHSVVASGRTRDGLAYWWAGTVIDGGTAKFSYAMASSSGPGQLDCVYAVPGATNVDLAGAAFDTFDRLVLAGWAMIGGLQRFVVARIPLPEASCGALDSGFDETGGNADGWAIYSFANHAQMNAMALDRLGGITLVGRLQGTPDRDVLVVRLLSNGHLDTGFDGDGVKTLDWAGANDSGTAIAVAENPAGSLHLWVAAYVTWNSPPTNTDEDFYVVKLDTAGALESNHTITFDAGGQLNDEPTGIAWDASRKKVYVVGTVNESSQSNLIGVARLGENGALDGTFSGDGRMTLHLPGNPATAFDFPTAVAVQTDGKAVVVGVHADSTAPNYDVGVARLTGAGNLDASFDTDGRTLVAFDLGGELADIAADITLADGRPLVGLSAQDSSTTSVPALFRLWNPLIFRDGFESGLLEAWRP